MSLINHLNDSVRGTPLASEQSMRPLELSDKYRPCDPQRPRLCRVGSDREGHHE
jgi:hypothetical protein